MGRESHFTGKKDRVFVRGIQGDYGLKEELARLRSMPRVVKGRDLLFNDGPQSFSKHFIEPVDAMTQTLHIHLEEYAPGATKPARALVLKSKPMIMFMNLLFQKTVIPRPTEATPEGKSFEPRHFGEHLNHAD